MPRVCIRLLKWSKSHNQPRSIAKSPFSAQPFRSRRAILFCRHGGDRSDRGQRENQALVLRLDQVSPATDWLVLCSSRAPPTLATPVAHDEVYSSGFWDTMFFLAAIISELFARMSDQVTSQKLEPAGFHSGCQIFSAWPSSFTWRKQQQGQSFFFLTNTETTTNLS